MDALTEVEVECDTLSAQAAREPLLRARQEFHELWYGQEVPVPPRAGQYCVGGRPLQEGRYRSTANYISRAKDLHTSERPRRDGRIG